MLTTVAGWKLFTAGMANSLILVLGALAAPLAGALWRAAAWLVVVTRQSSPVVLTLVVAATIRQAIFGYAPAAAPEPLSALSDVTSFANRRMASDTIILVFDVAVVMVVVRACEPAHRRLRRARAAP